MAHNRCFVQFSHPGREHEPDRATEKTWNTQKHGHARKFMPLHGQWIDQGGGKQAGDLYAWGEWEPESAVVSALHPPDGDFLYPRSPRRHPSPFKSVARRADIGDRRLVAAA